MSDHYFNAKNLIHINICFCLPLLKCKISSVFKSVLAVKRFTASLNFYSFLHYLLF